MKITFFIRHRFHNLHSVQAYIFYRQDYIIGGVYTLISDHAPLLLKCKGIQQSKKAMKLETFWFRYEVPKAMVRQLWVSGSGFESDSGPSTGLISGYEPGSYIGQEKLTLFHYKTELLHRSLRLWHSQSFGQLDKRLQEFRDEILKLDKLEESRPLNLIEFNHRIQLRHNAYELAVNLEERWKQRSHCNWLALGDRNTRFFDGFGKTEM